MGSISTTLSHLIIMCIVGCIQTNAQLTYVPGYIIDNNDKKTTCYILDHEWQHTPTSFNYKLTESGAIKETDISVVKEFGIENRFKYQRYTVEIDRSSSLFLLLDDKMKPEFTQETLFLQVLNEGTANLYMYKDILLTRFFIETAKLPIKQLVRKFYAIESRKMRQNVQYKQQLINLLDCPSISKERILKTDYKEKGLSKLITQYNECKEPSIISFEKPIPKHKVNFSPIIGYAANNFQKRTILAGLEIEYILPFLRNKFSFLINPILINYKFTDATNTTGNYLTSSAAVRHYFHLENDDKIYVTLYKYPETELSTSFRSTDRHNSAIGLGISFNGNFRFEYRFDTTSRVIPYFKLQVSQYSSHGLYLSYTLN